MFRFAVAPRLRSRRVFGALAAVAIGALVSLGVSTTASAVTAPSIRLHVQTSAADASPNVGVESARVSLWRLNPVDDTWSQNGSDIETTGLDGVTPFFTGLTSGDRYAVYIDATAGQNPGDNSSVADSGGWFNPATGGVVSEFDGSSTYFTATSGQVDATATLNVGSTLSGTVEQPVVPDPSDAADEIDFYRETTDPNGAHTLALFSSLAPTPGVSADYSVDNLIPGQYVVAAYQHNHPTWATRTIGLGLTSFENAPTVTVGSGSPTANLQFVAGVSVSGTVGLSPSITSSQPIAEVTAYPLNGAKQSDQSTADDSISTFVTPNTGAYSLELAPGSYAIDFLPAYDAANSATTYYGTWNGNVSSAAESTKVTIENTSDTKTDVDATIGQGVTVHGTVTGGGQVLQGISVGLFKANGDLGGGGTTDMSGHYSITAPPGTYTLQFSDPNGIYPDRYYSGATDGTVNPSLATSIIQATGTIAADFAYDSYSTLTVHVTNKAGTALSNVYVQAESITDGGPTPNAGVITADAVAGHPGDFTLSGLQQAQGYALYFSPSGSAAAGTYAQFLGGGDNPYTSDLYYPVSASSSLAVTLSAAAGVSGKVTTTSNKPIRNIIAELSKFDGTSWSPVDDRVTSSSGTYSFANLATGSYTVRFFPLAASSPYVSTWAGGATDAADATHVYVAPGKPAVVNQHLASGGTIAGVVAGPGGSPKLPLINVSPVHLTGVPGAFTAATPNQGLFATSSASGKFSLSGLATGYYALSFSDASGTLTYGDPYVSPITNPSTPVYHVTAGKTTTVPGTIDLPLLLDQQSAVLSGSLDLSGVGTFDDASGAVHIFTSDGETFVTDASLNPDGTFSVALVPGSYSYTADIFDADHPENLFAEDTGTVDVVAGANPALVLGVTARTALQFSVDPQITDTSVSKVGTVFYLNTPHWNHADTSVSYQWLRSGRPIYGATGTSYVAQPADLGAQLEVRVTVSDYYPTFGVNTLNVNETIVGYATAADEIAPSDALVNTALPTTTADGASATPGHAVHANPGSWNGITGLTFQYAWYLDGTSTVLGTGPTFVPTAAEADANATVRLSVTASETGYTTPPAASDSATFVISGLAAPTVKRAPHLTSHVVGSTTVYTVTPGSWSVSGGTPVYQWTTDKGVTAQTSNTYIFDPAIDGATSQLVVTVGSRVAGHRMGQTNVLARSSQTPVTATTAPGVTDSGSHALVASQGSPVLYGETLTANTAGLGFAGDVGQPLATTFSFKWQRLVGSTEVTIPGATHSTYVVGVADLGNQLRVVITVGGFAHTPQQWISFAGTGVALDGVVLNPATITPATTNTNNIGTKISETVGAWGSVAAVSNTYQWWFCSQSPTDCASAPGTTNYSLIPGARSTTLKPIAAMAHDSVVLVVTGTKTGYATGRAISDPVVIGTGFSFESAPRITSGLDGSGNAVLGKKVSVTPGVLDTSGANISYVWIITTFDPAHHDYPGAGTQNGPTYTPVLADFTGRPAPLFLSVEEVAQKGSSAVSISAGVVSLVGAVPVPSVKPAVTTTPSSWTVSDGMWPVTDGIGTVSYQWYTDTQPTSNTTNTFDRSTVTAANEVSVTVTYGGTVGYQDASVSFVVQVGSAPAWASQPVTGTPQFGSTLHAQTDPYNTFLYPPISNQPPVLTYQWYSGTTPSTGKAISKATGSTFTPSTALIGKYVWVVYTGASPYYANAVHASDPELIAPGDVVSGTPAISDNGSVYPGEKVGATLTGYTTGVAHAYSWQLSANGTDGWAAISGATKPTYPVPVTAPGKFLRVVVTTTKSGYGTATDYSDTQPVVEPTALTAITAPTVVGTGAVGTVLTVSPGSWNVAGITVTYAWYRDGILIPGATGTSYSPTGDQLGETVTVQVTAHAAGYDPVTLVPGATTVVPGEQPVAMPTPNIQGIAAVGSTLTATTGVWSLDGLTLTYQWYSHSDLGSDTIAGATSSTFTPDASLVGYSVYVVVTATRTGYLSGRASSGTTLPVG